MQIMYLYYSSFYTYVYTSYSGTSFFLLHRSFFFSSKAVNFPVSIEGCTVCVGSFAASLDAAALAAAIPSEEGLPEK